MKCRRCRKPNNSQRGIQLIEFALVLPLLVMLFLVAGEGGAMVRTHQVLNNAAREGARLAASPGSEYIYQSGNALNSQIRNQIIDQVRNYVVVNYATVNAANLTITISATKVPVSTPTTGGGFDTSVVTVSYPYHLRYLPSFGVIPSTINLRASAQFRNLY